QRGADPGLCGTVGLSCLGSDVEQLLPDEVAVTLTDVLVDDVVAGRQPVSRALSAQVREPLFVLAVSLQQLADKPLQLRRARLAACLRTLCELAKQVVQLIQAVPLVAQLAGDLLDPAGEVVERTGDRLADLADRMDEAFEPFFRIHYGLPLATDRSSISLARRSAGLSALAAGCAYAWRRQRCRWRRTEPRPHPCGGRVGAAWRRPFHPSGCLCPRTPPRRCTEDRV